MENLKDLFLLWHTRLAAIRNVIQKRHSFLSGKCCLLTTSAAYTQMFITEANAMFLRADHNCCE